MNRDGHENLTFFTGIEVEKTPAYQMRTLFVIGLQDIEEIIQIAEVEGCNHIYLGANMSYDPDEAYDDVVFPLLNKNYWVTLDFDIRDVEWVLESGYTEYRRFIPMISAKLPYIDQLGYNATLKLDDKDFDATNPGVWCHRVHELKSKESFTNWDEYLKDKPHAIE